MKEKLNNNIYYVVIVVVSLFTLIFFPMLGSTIVPEWDIPDNSVGWTVWIITRLAISGLNLLIFHSFVKQAKVNIKDNPRYVEANKIYKVEKDPQAKKPRNPQKYISKLYLKKGTSVFLSTLAAVVGFSQAVLTYDYVSLITFLITIITCIMFGIITMKETENYWTNEFPEYVEMLEKQLKEEAD